MQPCGDRRGRVRAGLAVPERSKGRRLQVVLVGRVNHHLFRPPLY
jgi:hypothetical protein